ncbi:hypothetical protein DO97_16115 [Neosynechococcus sphagnicola sy1]|uniref:Methyltransferase domain-containing protein n=1 Tax=Neosynechococcus sphagnicola sy1 TaxID=1497020 RepID=A0A098THW6_9CYAN|nr:class I SAM-dependent methyltransferase [Neosynechococcus sphagnicola]KGF71699.1 hypothetical protein DO97_16115 [Neosynechococcus sphagnicola sy1]
MPQQFTYTHRDHCPCGAQLETTQRRVIKSLRWGQVQFVECRRCRTMVQSPQISTEALAQWYDSADYQAAGADKEGAYLDYLADEPQRQLEAQARYHRDLAKILVPGSQILEVGCATGSLLAAMKAAGHQVLGIDLSAQFAQQARALNQVEVIVSEFFELSGTALVL